MSGYRCKCNLSLLLKKNNYRCHLCGKIILSSRPKEMSKRQWKLIEPSRDHIIPHSKAKGLHNNIRPAHAICNAIRSNEPIVFHRMKRMMFAKFPSLEKE